MVKLYFWPSTFEKIFLALTENGLGKSLKLNNILAEFFFFALVLFEFLVSGPTLKHPPPRMSNGLPLMSTLYDTPRMSNGLPLMSALYDGHPRVPPALHRLADRL